MTFLKKLFRSESHYIATVAAIVLIYVFYMHFAFNPEWADNASALKFVKAMENIVPAIHHLRAESGLYTSYWGLFFLD